MINEKNETKIAEHEDNLKRLQINNNRLTIEIKKKRAEIIDLKKSMEISKELLDNNKVEPNKIKNMKERNFPTRTKVQRGH